MTYLPECHFYYLCLRRLPRRGWLGLCRWGWWCVRSEQTGCRLWSLLSPLFISKYNIQRASPILAFISFTRRYCTSRLLSDCCLSWLLSPASISPRFSRYWKDEALHAFYFSNGRLYKQPRKAAASARFLYSPSLTFTWGRSNWGSSFVDAGRRGGVEKDFIWSLADTTTVCFGCLIQTKSNFLPLSFGTRFQLTLSMTQVGIFTLMFMLFQVGFSTEMLIDEFIFKNILITSMAFCGVNIFELICLQEVRPLICWFLFFQTRKEGFIFFRGTLYNFELVCLFVKSLLFKTK